MIHFPKRNKPPPPKIDKNKTFLDTKAVNCARSTSELKFETRANKTEETDCETIQILSAIETATEYKPIAASLRKYAIINKSIR